MGWLKFFAVVNVALLIATGWYLWKADAPWYFWILLYLAPAGAYGAIMRIGYFLKATPEKDRPHVIGMGLAWPLHTAVGLMLLFSGEVD